MTFPFPIVDTLSSALPSVVYNTSSSVDAGATTYSFSGLSIGTAATTRLVVCAFMGRASSRTGGSATFGGVSATKIVEQIASGGYHTQSMWAAVVPTGTTATCSITWSGSQGTCFVHCWSLYDLTSSTSTATNSSTATAPSPNLNLLTGDVLVLSASTNSSTTSTPTGYTESYDATQPGAAVVQQTAGNHVATSNESPRTLTTTFGAASFQIGIAAAWR